MTIKQTAVGFWVVVAACAASAFFSTADAQTYNRFGPADGILVGDVDSPQTTAAAASDVISLWTGTCNATTFLRADGSCQPASGGAGTVTSVGLTVPTGLSVTGSPITTSGTLAISTTLNGLLRGTGSGFATAASSNVISLWTGTCDSTTFLRGDGSCVAPGGGGGGGTVTSVGLTMPTGFTVTGSPVTSSGSLAVSTSLNGVLRGTGTGFATASSGNIITLWTGSCGGGTFLRGDGTCQATGDAFLSSNQTFTGENTFSNARPITLSGTNAIIRRSTNTEYLRLVGGNADTLADGPRITLYGAGHATTPNALAIASNGTITVNNQDIRDTGLFTSGTLPVARGGTGTTTSTGTGSVVLSGSPTFTGTVTGGTFSGTFSGSGTSITNLNAANISSGTLPVARGGTGTTTSTGTGNVVLSNSPTFTGTVNAGSIASSGTVAAATEMTVAGVNVCRQNGTNCPSTGGSSGVYTPSVFVISNLNASPLSATQHQWSRVGNIVTVSGRLILNVISGGGVDTAALVSLPVPSNFTTSEQAHGSGTTDTINAAPAFVYPHAVSDGLQVHFWSTSSGNQTVYYTAQYEVL